MVSQDPASAADAARSAAKNARRSMGWRRRVRRLAVVVVATYAGVCVLVGWFQARLIYFPSRDLRSTPADIGLAYEEVTLQTEDRVALGAWSVSAPQARGTVIYCHGNAGNIADRLTGIRLLAGMGVNVLAFDYRGYGRSEGSPDEQGTYRDADAAWRYVVEARGEAAERVILFGESLGGAVAIELASRRPVGALIVEATFTSLVDVAQRHYPLLPVGLLLRHRYDSIERIGLVPCPKLFIHAREDELVPPELARRLYDKAQPPKRFLETPGGHNTGGFTYGSDYAQQVAEFLAEVLPTRTAE